MATQTENNLAIIEQEVRSNIALNNIRLALGSEADMEQAKLYAAGVLNEIRRSAGNEYGDLTKCSPDSIIHAMIDGARFKINIDGRKLAHLEMRYNKDKKCNEAILQIDTNGFVFKIAEFYPDVTIMDVAVFEGDEFEINHINGIRDFTHRSKNPFQSHEKLQGIAVKISYTDGDKKIQTVEEVSKAELDAMAAKGKGTAWKDFPLERRRTAAIKRACKWHFRKITGLKEIIDYDNHINTDLNAPVPKQPGIIDNLNRQLTGDPAPENGQETQGTTESVNESATDYSPADEIIPPKTAAAKKASGKDCMECVGKGFRIDHEENKEPCEACSGTGKAA